MPVLLGQRLGILGQSLYISGPERIRITISIEKRIDVFCEAEKTVG